MMHMIAGVGLMLAQLVPPTKAVPATSTSKEMYDFWCTPARMSSILCQHHDLIAKMGAAKADEDKKGISEKIKSLLKAASPAPVPGAPRPPSPFSKEYSQMKMSYCSSNPAGAKLMCSTAASQFKAGASSTKPSSASSSVTLSNNEVWNWYCAKAKKTEEVEKLCTNNKKRSGILDQLRTGGSSAEARKGLLEQLKLAPPPAYATTQALYTDFCKVPENGEKPTCMRVKASQASNSMRNWYCATTAGSTGDWCKRQAVLSRMQYPAHHRTHHGRGQGPVRGAQEARRGVYRVLAAACGGRPLQGVDHRQGDRICQEALLRAGVHQDAELLQGALRIPHRPARHPPPPHPVDLPSHRPALAQGPAS